MTIKVLVKSIIFFLKFWYESIKYDFLGCPKRQTQNLTRINRVSVYLTSVILIIWQ